MYSEVKKFHETSIEINEPVYTIQMLLELLGEEIPSDVFGSIRDLLQYRKRLVNKAFQSGTLTSFNHPINQTPLIKAKTKDFLSDSDLQKRLKECFNPTDKVPSTRIEILRYLSDKNKLSESEKLENYFYVQHKVVKCYLQTFLTTSSDVEKMVLAASENRAIAGLQLFLYYLLFF